MAEPTPKDPADELSKHPAVRDYTLVGVSALLILTLGLSQDGLGWWSVLPALVGSVTLLVHWSIGPPLVLLLLIVLTLARVRQNGIPRFFDLDSSLLGDAVLAMAMVVYLGCSFRLQALVRGLFPADPRLQGRSARTRRTGRRWLLPGIPRTRHPDAVRTGEIARLVVSGVLCGGLALLLWLHLQMNFFEPLLPTMPLGVWHVLIVLWVGGVTVVVLRGLLGYRSWLQATREEALLYLQDQTWRQTRGEQGRIWLWLTAAGLKARRGKK
jgi:hypothetical protein